MHVYQNFSQVLLPYTLWLTRKQDVLLERLELSKHDIHVKHCVYFSVLISWYIKNWEEFELSVVTMVFCCSTQFNVTSDVTCLILTLYTLTLVLLLSRLFFLHFPLILTRRIWLAIRSFLNWLLKFPLFSWSLQEWYCRDTCNLLASHS